MLDSDKHNFLALMKATFQLYDKEVSTEVVRIYWEALKQYDFLEVSEAFSRHIQNPDTGQFAPKPADIRKMLDGTTTDAAFIAWTKAEKAIRSVGSYESVVFDDPIVMKVIVDMGGWIALCSHKESDMPFVAKEFQTRYRGYKTVGKVQDFPRQLVGRAEAENNLLGFKSDPPRLIGNPEQAQQILLSGNSGSNTPLKQIAEFVKIGT